jgi:hypothetical protein
MFRSAANAASEADGDLKAALERTAERSRGTTKDLAELLEIFYEVGRLGPNERSAATELLDTFLRFALGNRG